MPSHTIGPHSTHWRPDSVPVCEQLKAMRVLGRTGNAWPLEQVLMEIISGDSNVNKSLTDLGMGEDRERLDEN